MTAPGPKEKKTPKELLRGVMELCADCDTCRTMLEEECVFFPELYRLWDREREGGAPITDEELRRLVDLCTFCGLCPCPRIPADVMEAKSRYVAREGGLPTSVKLLIDVPRMARICGTFPSLYNAVRNNQAVAPLLRRLTRCAPGQGTSPPAGGELFPMGQEEGAHHAPGGRAHGGLLCRLHRGIPLPGGGALGRAGAGEKRRLGVRAGAGVLRHAVPRGRRALHIADARPGKRGAPAARSQARRPPGGVMLHLQLLYEGAFQGEGLLLRGVSGVGGCPGGRDHGAPDAPRQKGAPPAQKDPVPACDAG